MLQLRDYQSEAVKVAMTYMNDETNRIIHVMPTGSGKTVVQAAIIDQFFAANAKSDKIALVVVNRNEILHQTVQALDSQSDKLTGVWTHDEWLDSREHLPRHNVIVTTMQRLCNGVGASTLPPLDLLIVDEAHHAPAPVYKRLVESLGAKHTIGFTATPHRTDGVWLPEVFGPLAYGISTAQLMLSGYLSDVLQVNHELPDDVHVKANAIESIVQTTGKNMIVYANSVKDGRDLAGVLNARNKSLDALFIDGETNRFERQLLVNKFRQGKSVLINVDVFTEGFDVPECSVIVIDRQLRNPTRVAQIVGRCLRPAAGKHLSCVYFLRPAPSIAQSLTGPHWNWLERAMLVEGKTMVEAMLERFNGKYGSAREEVANSETLEWFKSGWVY